MKRICKTAIGLFCAVLAVLPLSACDESTAASASAETSVQTKTVTQGDLIVGLTADGTVALPVTNLNFEVEGIVGKIYVEAGDSVNKGDLLAELESDDYELAIETARTALERAQTNYTDAQWNYEHTLKQDKIALDEAKEALSAVFDPTSYQEAIVSARSKYYSTSASGDFGALPAARDALAKAEAALVTAEEEFKENQAKAQQTYQLQKEAYEKSAAGSATVQNAATAVKEAQLTLDDALNAKEKIKIYAPLDATVLTVSKKEGEQVSAVIAPGGGAFVFGTSGSSNSVITLLDPTTIYLTASITEGDVVGVEVGQVVRAELDAIGEGEVFPGKVTAVSSLPTTDSSGITTYSVTIALDKPDSQIKDGMTALLTFVRLEHTNVLMVANKCIYIEDGVQYADVRTANGATEKRKVSCGLTNGTETEVLSGLEKGETVLVHK
ncbi:MAG: biotin/lipoyl-binding protein [Oscillospiraceae bacterium]|jgi:HlyD family secretion protein|nr:biotin/lipoyl-binding protein [Oscillospiraceae bacterium]